MYESPEHDSVFFSANGSQCKFSMLKLFSKNYEISQLTLDHPVGIIIQNKNDFNFNDLIEKFSSKNDFRYNIAASAF